MDGNIKIGRLFGIPISINYSWIVIFLLISWALFFQFSTSYPVLGTSTHLVMGFLTSVLFFSSVLFHEMTHSLIARHYGVPIIAINLWVFGGMAQMSDEPKTPAIEFIMSIAGPFSSFFLGGAFAVLARFFRLLDFGPAFFGPAFWLSYINMLLGAFNLLPGFPLDGGRVLRSVVWYFTGSIRRATKVASLGGKTIAYLLIGGGFVFLLTLGNIGGLWFILLGWVLLQAAESGYRQVVLKQALEGVRVMEVMTESPSTVNSEMMLDTLVHDYFMRYRWGAFPVVDNETVKGLITLHDVREVSRDEWPSRRVSEIMRPLTSDIVTQPLEKLTDVLPRLESKAGGRMLVLKDGHLVGILTRTDVSRFIKFRLELEE
jgi:Zn-dependent protease